MVELYSRLADGNGSIESLLCQSNDIPDFRGWTLLRPPIDQRKIGVPMEIVEETGHIHVKLVPQVDGPQRWDAVHDALVYGKTD